MLGGHPWSFSGGGICVPRIPAGGENESASFFSIMFDSRSVSVQRSSAVLRNVSGNAPTACAHRTPNDAERVFQCQGDESLAAELIISITHGRVAQTPPPPPLHAHTRWASTTSANQFGSGLLSGLGGTCWEVGAVEERDG